MRARERNALIPSAISHFHRKGLGTNIAICRDFLSAAIFVGVCSLCYSSLPLLMFDFRHKKHGK